MVPTTATAATSSGSGPSITVCDDEQLNLNDSSGTPLSSERLSKAKAALQYMCDSQYTIRPRSTGSYVTNTTKAEVKTCTCASRYNSWWVKITATGLPKSGDKWVDVIYRIGPGGSGKWTSGPANYVGPSTTYANLPLVSGTMSLSQYVETVGTYTRNGKIVEQIRGSA
jgi:hypothetical protein